LVTRASIYGKTDYSPRICLRLFIINAPANPFFVFKRRRKMKKNLARILIAFVIVSFCVFPLVGRIGGVQAHDSYPRALKPSLSADGRTLYNGVPPLVVVADPNPAMRGIQAPTEPKVAAAIANPKATNAAFSFTYVAAGGTDPWGAVCQTFPDQAKTAFTAAAAIWTSTIQSSVPITISACWSNLGSSSILGYSGGAYSYRDFSGAPKPNTWYESSLANALYGSDLDPSRYDDYITYNSGFTWYYGTDGYPTAGTYDLVTVAAHEIAHGLNFSGTAAYAAGTGNFGSLGYPNIYDTFMEDAVGTKLTAYTTPSTALGSLLTSGSLWFNGTNANAANGGSRVKIYAPGTWSSGSSYAHLDYSTFAGTANSMMVYAVSSASAQHNPGVVTTGLLKDLGWVLAGASTVKTIYLPLVSSPSPPPGGFNKIAPANGATGQPANPTLSWGASSGATSYEYCYDTTNDNACTTWTSSGASTSVGLSGLTPATYYWQVRANNTGGTTLADGGAWWTFTSTGSSAGPTPGYWQSSAGYTNFYVTADRSIVREFSILVNLPGCGTYWIYRTNPAGDAPISSNQFSFSGPFYASGTFDSSTTAHGISGLNSYGPVCGSNWMGGPWSWSATWQDSSQPASISSARADGTGFLEAASETTGSYIAVPVK
jgi:hypothetical protein